MDLGLRQSPPRSWLDTQHPATLIRTDADGREDGSIADPAAMAHLFVSRVEDEVLHLAKRPGAPGLQFLVEQFRGTADLAQDDRLSMPNSRMTASASRVETPLIYISATASITARDLTAAAFQ